MTNPMTNHSPQMELERATEQGLAKETALLERALALEQQLAEAMKEKEIAIEYAERVAAVSYYLLAFIIFILFYFIFFVCLTSFGGRGGLLC